PEKPVGQPPSKPPQRRLKPPRPSGPDPAAPASSRHQPQPSAAPAAVWSRWKLLENAAVLADFPTSVSPSSGHQISRTRSPANPQEDLREVQLARTSCHRRTKETTRAISLASDPPPKCRSSLGDSAEFLAEVGRKLIKERVKRSFVSDVRQVSDTHRSRLGFQRENWSGPVNYAT
ncbi:hypothetical protein Prudu_527S000300, partial [Prunus dulcis]